MRPARTAVSDVVADLPAVVGNATTTPPTMLARSASDGADGHVVAVPHERQPQQPRVREQSFTMPVRVQREELQALIAVGARRRVEERRSAQSLDEPPQLARRDRALLQVHEMDGRRAAP